MKKMKSKPKTGSSMNTKELRAKINLLIEKNTKKLTKKVESLEKAIEKLKGAKAKPSESMAIKKSKSTPSIKKRGSNKKLKAINEGLG